MEGMLTRRLLASGLAAGLGTGLALGTAPGKAQGMAKGSGLSGQPAEAPPGGSRQPIVVELFTSQSCSSCPPADALLVELAERRPDLLPLDFHVTYWNRLGWRDPLSLPEATERQRRYAAGFGRDMIYTPQMVVQGRFQAVGSDRRAVAAAIEAARAAAGPPVPLALRPEAGGLVVEAGAAAPGGPRAATLLLVGFDPRHVTRVGGGENHGRTLVEANVVRSLAPVAEWRGSALRLAHPMPAGQRAAVLLQAADGAILAAAVLAEAPVLSRR